MSFVPRGKPNTPDSQIGIANGERSLGDACTDFNSSNDQGHFEKNSGFNLERLRHCDCTKCALLYAPAAQQLNSHQRAHARRASAKTRRSSQTKSCRQRQVPICAREAQQPSSTRRYGAATGPASRRANKLALFARNFRGEQEGRDRPRADGRSIITTMTPQMLFLVILGAVDALAPADNRAGLLHLLTQRSVQTNVYYLTNFHDEPKAKWLARYREPVVQSGDGPDIGSERAT